VAVGDVLEQPTIRPAEENTMTSELATDSWVNTVVLRFSLEMASEFKRAAWKLY
jgi:hypothetical protein